MTFVEEISVVEVPSESAVNGIFDAYSDHAYEQGYTRGQRDLLATYPLLVEQFLRVRNIQSVELRRELRLLGDFILASAEARDSDPDFVSDGLGI